MENPISAKTRGTLYLLGIIAGILVALLVPFLRLMGVGVEVQEFATLAAGVMLTLLATLSRANLSDPSANVASGYDPNVEGMEGLEV